MPRSLQAWAGELVGTFLFFTIGAGAVILATSGQVPGSGLLAVALAHAFGLGVAITIFGHISGGHFNPAVTLSAWVGKKISSADALGYIACQMLGGLGAGIFLRVAFQESVWRGANLGSPPFTDPMTAGRAILIEAVLTFILVLTIWGTGVDERGPRVGGFAIGLVLGGMILAFGPTTGVFLNPARFLGPAAVAGNVDHWWVYVIGPAIGAVAAGLLYQTAFWDGWPLARIGGSPDMAPDTVSEPPASIEEGTTPRPAPVRKAPPARRSTPAPKAAKRKPVAKRKPARRR